MQLSNACPQGLSRSLATAVGWQKVSMLCYVTSDHSVLYTVSLFSDADRRFEADHCVALVKITASGVLKVR